MDFKYNDMFVYIPLQMLARQETKVRIDAEDRQFFTFVLNSAGIPANPAPLSFLRSAKAACEANTKGDLPDLALIAEHLLSYKLSKCPCLLEFPRQQVLAAIEYNVTELEMTMTCNVVISILEFHALEQRYPSNEQLGEFLTNSQHLQQDPDNYCNEKRHALPTANLHLLERVKLAKEDTCSICREDMKCSKEVFRLPVCKHVFHADENECLGAGSSILTWLQKNRKCPNCNAEVTLGQPEPVKVSGPV
jgi:hypothetical protein